MPIPVITEIVDVIVIAAVVTDLGRPDEKSILVVVKLVALIVVVPEICQLRDKAEGRKILTKHIGDKDIVLAQWLGDRVQTAIRVLFDAAEIGKVVLPAV